MRRAKQISAAVYYRTDMEGVSTGKTLRKNDETNVIQGFRRKRLHPRTMFALYGAHFVLTLIQGFRASRFTLALCSR